MLTAILCCTKPFYGTARLYYPCAIIYLQTHNKSHGRYDIEWYMGYREYRVGQFGNDFHEWLRHSWNSLPNRLTRDKKKVFTNIHTLFNFLRAILCSGRAHKPSNTIIDCHSSICEVTWKRVTGIVTSYSSIVRARANWCNGDLHCWITTVDIGFSGGWKFELARFVSPNSVRDGYLSPPGIHGLACKKIWICARAWSESKFGILLFCCFVARYASIY